MPDLTARLSAVIYPVMLLGGAAWGATGKPGTGLAVLLLAALVLGAAKPNIGLRRQKTVG